VIVAAYSMRKEAGRSLHSLTRQYQPGTEKLDCEVVVIDNGSSERLGEGFVGYFGENFSYVYLQGAPKSPA
jgi:hypothetical protein